LAVTANLAAPLVFTGGLLVAAALVFLVTWSCHQLAALLFPSEAASVRLAAAFVLGMAGLIEGFFVLAHLGIFNLWAGLGFWGAVAAALRWRRARVRTGSLWIDLTCAGRLLWQPRLRVVVVVAGLVPALKLMRGLSSPPMAWDAIT
jgi:hypothetical protein